MGDTVEKAKTQITGFWKELDKKRKIKLGVTCGLLLICITVFILYITTENYEVLYKDLSLKDTAAVTKKLEELNVKWKSGDTANTILVPSKERNKVKLNLAYEGLPKEGYGVREAFDDMSWTMTELEKKEIILEGKKSELADTITAIDGVEDTSLYVELPEENTFLNKQLNGTASVCVKLSSGSSLEKEKVTAIRNMVAGAFKNLKPEGVVITDTYGNYYDIENGSDAQGFSLNEQLKIKNTSQTMLDNSIKKFLEKLFGRGNVDVRTSIKMNFDSENTSIVQFSPPVEGRSEGLVRSMQKIKEYTSDGQSGGPAGVESNVNDTVDYATGDNDKNKYEKASDTINYELNQINREVRKNPGEIESLSVAIIINKDAIDDGELTQERKSEIEELIFAATGISTKKVIVSTGRFKNNINDMFNNNINNKSQADNLMLYGILGAALFTMMAAGGLLIMRKRKKDKEQQMLDEKYQENEIEDIEFQEKSGYKDQINGFVEKKPDAVAQLLRSWLSEE